MKKICSLLTLVVLVLVSCNTKKQETKKAEKSILYSDTTIVNSEKTKNVTTYDDTTITFLSDSVGINGPYASTTGTENHVESIDIGFDFYFGNNNIHNQLKFVQKEQNEIRLKNKVDEILTKYEKPLTGLENILKENKGLFLKFKITKRCLESILIPEHNKDGKHYFERNVFIPDEHLLDRTE